MLNRLKTWLGLRKSGITLTEFIRLMAGGEITRLRDYEGYLEAGLKKVWATFKAIDLIAQEAASTPVKVTIPGSTKPVTDKALLELLANPNPYCTWWEFIYLIIFHFRLTGNAYVYKAEQTMAGTKPTSLWPLNPKRVKPVANSDGWGIASYDYQANGRTVKFTADEIIHIKRPHPNNDFLGLGDVEAAEPLFNHWLNRQSWDEGFFKNGAAPSGIMTYEGEGVPDQADFEKLKKDWDTKYAGGPNTGKTAWVAGKWKYQQLGLTIAEMQSIEQSRLAIENIFTLHGVPLSVAGIRESANFATAEIDDQRFRRYGILPNLLLVQFALQKYLISGFNPNYRLAFELGGLFNVGQILTQYSGLYDRGCITPNELRELCHLPRVDDPIMDQYNILAGYVPLALSGIADLTTTEKAADRQIERFVAGLETRRTNETN